MKNQTVEDLCKWFSSQCVNDWHHYFGIDIQTTDNPGWIIKINLSGTTCEGKCFNTVSMGDFSANNPNPPWFRCHVEDNVFIGAGDINQLVRIIDIFICWTKDRGQGNSLAHSNL